MDNSSSSDQAFRPAPPVVVRSFPGGKVRLPRLDDTDRLGSPSIEVVGTAFARGGTVQPEVVEPSGFSGYFTTESLFDEPPEDLESTESEDPYKVLRCSTEASWNEISTAYRTLVKEFHPDRFVDHGPSVIQDAEIEIKRITRAYGAVRRIHPDVS